MKVSRAHLLSNAARLTCDRVCAKRRAVTIKKPVTRKNGRSTSFRLPDPVKSDLTAACDHFGITQQSYFESCAKRIIGRYKKALGVESNG